MRIIGYTLLLSLFLSGLLLVSFGRPQLILLLVVIPVCTPLLCAFLYMHQLTHRQRSSDQKAAEPR